MPRRFRCTEKSRVNNSYRLGVVAGATQGASNAVTEVKGSNDPLGVITAAILGGLLGGAAGCAASSAIGVPIDETICKNFRCQTCGHVFDASRVDPSAT
jgi:hypothetical protein